MAGHHPCSQKESRKPCETLEPWPVGPVERRAEILEELRTVGRTRGAELVEDLDRQACWVRGRLQHQRRDGADQHGLGDAFVPCRPM